MLLWMDKLVFVFRASALKRILISIKWTYLMQMSTVVPVTDAGAVTILPRITAPPSNA